MRRYHSPEQKFGRARCWTCNASFVKHRHGQRFARSSACRDAAHHGRSRQPSDNLRYRARRERARQNRDGDPLPETRAGPVTAGFASAMGSRREARQTAEIRQ